MHIKEVQELTQLLTENFTLVSKTIETHCGKKQRNKYLRLKNKINELTTNDDAILNHYKVGDLVTNKRNTFRL